MRKIQFTLLVLIYGLFANAQQDFGGKPVLGAKPLKRNTAVQENREDLSKNINSSLLTPSSPTGSSTEVGVTEGALSVSLTGGANYSIPIAVPPGINGVVPQIGLSYNSQGGNGIAGFGWNINGVSTITRIPSTKFHDGIIDPVDFDNWDRFAFDGQRLVLKNVSDVYGANGTVYETENFSNVKITSYGTHPAGANYGPAYFLVEYPDGSKAYYGNSTDSKSLMEYSITYWENPQGVRISYSYTTSGNVLSIDKIKYGTIGTVLPINEIQFEYKTRLRPEQSYITGQSIIRSNILSKIHVFGNNIGFRNYDLIYDSTSLGYERLISITEKCGDNSLSYNPTVFSYNNTLGSISNNLNTTLSVSGIEIRNSETVSGDFDGDGEMDFLLYPSLITDPNYKKKFWLYYDLPGHSTNNGWEVPCGSFEEIFPTTWLNADNKIVASQGIAVVQNAPMSPYVNNVNINTLYIAPYGIYTQYQKSIQFTNTLKRKYISGDFNGDGITDVLAIEWDANYPGQNGVHFIDLDRRKTTNYFNYAGTISVEDMTRNAENFKLDTGDFNGDGRTDLIVFGISTAKVYSLDENNQIVLLWSKPIQNGDASHPPILMGDYNGDGKTDFMMPQGEGSYWDKYTSTGISFYMETKHYQNLEWWLPYGVDVYHIIPNDFNNDGKTDMLSITCSGNVLGGSGNGISIKLVINKNSDFYETDNTSASLGIGPVDKFALPIFYKSNQSNRKLEMAFIRDNKVMYFQSQKDFSKERLLSTITTGNGVKEAITYNSLQPASEYQSEYDAVYKDSGYTEIYPYSDIIVAPSFQVVEQLEKASKAVYKKQQFKYYGAVSSVEGLGFLGFRGIMRTNWFDDNGTQIISSVSKNDINLRGANVESYSVIGLAIPSSSSPTSGYISKSLNTYNMVNGVFENPLQLNKVYKLKSTFTQTFNGIDNTHSETETIYNTYNSPTTATTKLYNASTLEQTTISAVGYDPITTAPYIIGRPNSKTQAVTIYPGQGLPNEDATSSEEFYAYTNGLLTQIKKKVNSASYIFEDNEYDSFGNIKKKTISVGSLSRRVAKYDYDPSGRFLTKSYDIEDLMTEFDFDTSSGVLNWEKNPYLLQTKYYYDKWFKKTKITDYLLKNQTYGYARNNEKTIITNTADDGSSSNETFDDLGRKIKTGAKNISGNWSYIDYLYDIYDRNIKVSEPYFATPSQWSETQYDELGRISQKKAFTGKTATMTYSALTTIVDDGLKTKKSIKNAIGNVVSMTDTPGGIINYTYFANGGLKTTNYGGIVTTIQQDGWGRKWKLTDPSIGTYEYTYNDLGETLTEKSQKGITTYSINAVGKTDWKTIVGINGDTTNSKTTYNYNQTTTLLDSSGYDDYTAGNHIDYVYTYDSSNRLIKTTEKNSQTADFEHQTTYDGFGRPEKEFYSAKNNFDNKTSAKWIKNTYKNGYPYQILDDANQQILWQTNTVDERGQLLTAQYGYTNGNFIGTETHTYDAYGLPALASYRTTSGTYATTNPFMSLTTTFDPQRGNLTSRSNSAFDSKENFTYDNLDRLTSWNGDGQNLLTLPFNTTTDGFTFSGTSTYGSVSNSAGTLKVYLKGTFVAAQKPLAFNLTTNDKLNIKADVTGKIGTSGVIVNVIMVETDPTDALNYVEIYLGTINNGKFIETYTVSDFLPNPKLTLKFVVDESSPEGSNGGGPVAPNSTFYIDNLKIDNVSTITQNYDDRGRITTNNIGTYNYNPATVASPYQASSITLADITNTAYYNGREQNIGYNAFKSPVWITEQGRENIDFQYNAFNSRSTMYYGDLQSDKLSRKYRKFYSADGSMEIRRNKISNAVEFVTYIGGDGYSAPIVLKSDGVIQNYLYLHRDYQGSILAITNADGQVLEKRLFDAWGALVKYGNLAGSTTVPTTSDGLLLDRGYTGHEHLLGVGLINMNARLYDPKLHRFLGADNYVQDPSNTQSYNRYGYCWNNPLKYADYNGEWFGWDDLVVAGISFAIGYVSSGINTGQWGWSSVQSGLISAVVGWLAYNTAGGASGITSGSGVLNAPMWDFLASSAATSAVSLLYPPIGIQIDNFSFSISPSIAFGNASGIGVSLSATYTNGDFSFSGGIGIMSNSNYNGLGKNGEEIRKSILVAYDDGKSGVSLGTNFWSGDFAQRTGMLGLHFGDFRAMYENDGSIGGLGDGGDKFRTAALNLSVGEFTAGFNLMTGNRDYEGENGSVSQHRDPLCVDNYGRRMPNGVAKEDGTKYRLGALTVGYQGYRVGVNSEHVRHAIQNQAIHNLRIPWFNGKSLFDKRQMGFENQSWDWKGYSQYRSSNMFTSW